MIRERAYTLIHNTLNKPNVWMANYLRRRNWVVFYLDPAARKCNGECWLHLYEQEIRGRDEQKN